MQFFSNLGEVHRFKIKANPVIFSSHYFQFDILNNFICHHTRLLKYLRVSRCP
jgi:hypothetical protein